MLAMIAGLHTPKRKPQVNAMDQVFGTYTIEAPDPADGIRSPGTRNDPSPLKASAVTLPPCQSRPTSPSWLRSHSCTKLSPPPVNCERQHMDSSGRPEPSYDLAGVDIPDADEPAATSHDGKQVGAAVEGEGQDPVAAHPDRPPETSSAAAVQFPNPGGAGQPPTT